MYGSSYQREVGRYCRKKIEWWTLYGDVATDGDYLENTNETFHAAIRYRRNSKNQKRLGYSDTRPFAPGNMDDFALPAKQVDGRVGAGSTAVKAADPLLYKYPRPTKDGKGTELLTYEESRFGWYEKIYLAFHDQDEELRKRDGSIWKMVLGGEG